MCCALQRRVLGFRRSASAGDGANSSGADEGSASEGSVAPAPVEVTPEVATASDVIEQEPLIVETTATVSADAEVSSKGDGVEPEATREEDEAAKQRTALKMRLLAQSAASNRGALATSWQKSDVEVIISELESRNPNRDVLQAKPSPLDGRWELVYSNVEQFRSSPFFWAFQEGLLEGNAAVAAAIFRFTDSIPGATVGRAIQQISLRDNLLVSEVDLEVFPRVSGTVITSCQVQASPVAANMLDVTVDNTRVSGENVLPFVQAVAVPVQDILERLRGPGATRVCLQLTYLDEELRVSRTQPDGNVFVYRRV